VNQRQRKYRCGDHLDGGRGHVSNLRGLTLSA
jgi:hypothetical protein